MKIILYGKNGQLGWELQRSLSYLGELVALDRKGTDIYCGDLSNEQGIVNDIRLIKPDIIVNAAAYTAVDKAEEETKQAFLINARAPEILAWEAASIGAWLVHYSTDYVFDGSGNNVWTELNKPLPLNNYGKSKLAGEEAIIASGCKHLIFRTSWVYSLMGNNFIKAILRLAKEKETLSIVGDQIGAPTGADFLADVTAFTLQKVIKNPSLSGLYHVSAQGEISWYDYAKFIVEKASELGEPLLVKKIFPIPSSDYPTLATRPLNSRLSKSKVTSSFSLQIPIWNKGVERVIKEILGKVQ